MIDTIERWQKTLYEQYGKHVVHASDEWYLLAGRELPEEERYDGYLQLENGVGMLRLLHNEFTEALAAEQGRQRSPGTVACNRKAGISDDLYVDGR